MSNIIDVLLKETSAGDIDAGRPELLALTRAINALIFSDLVAIQKTSSPIATLFGMRYLNRDGDTTFRTPATYGGMYGDRASVTVELSDAKKTFAKDEVFKYKKVIYQAIDAVDFDNLGGGSDIEKQLHLALMVNKVRIMSDAGTTASMEYVVPSESKFRLDRWKVEAKTRKLKSEISMELIQDLAASGIDGDSAIREMLAIELADEINRDIMHKLQTISARHESAATPSGIYFAGDASDDPTKGRTLYRIVSEMARTVQAETAFECTYVLCSARVAGLLTSSGWVKGDPNMNNLFAGVMQDGLKVYVDAVSRFDYVIVGTKHNNGGLDNIGSLFYAPYVEPDGVSVNLINSPDDFQPRYMGLTRYGLSANPYTTSTEGEQINAGDDWNNLAGKSKYSRFVGVVFE